jgi:hypothetical protein
MELIALIVLSVMVLPLLVIAGIFGIGLYLGWLSIGSADSPTKDDFRFTMDADRIQEEQNRANDSAKLGRPGDGPVQSAGGKELPVGRGALAEIPAPDLSSTKGTELRIDGVQQPLPKVKVVR